jgi:hypothetical protein
VNTVHYQLSRSELLFTGFRRKLLRPRFLLKLALLAACGIFLLSASNKDEVFFFVGLASILLAAIAPLQLFLVLRRIFTRYPWFTAPTTLTFSETGVAIVAPDYRSELDWSLFRSWSQSEHHMFLYIDDGDTAVTIPKRAFNPDQLQALFSQVARIKP